MHAGVYGLWLNRMLDDIERYASSHAIYYFVGRFCLRLFIH